MFLLQSFKIFRTIVKRTYKMIGRMHAGYGWTQSRLEKWGFRVEKYGMDEHFRGKWGNMMEQNRIKAVHRQNSVLIYVLLFALFLGIGAELAVGAPPVNLLTLGGGGMLAICLIGFFHYKKMFQTLIPYIAIVCLASVALSIMAGSNYVTNMLFVYFLLAVAAIALSLRVLATAGVIGVLLLVY